MTKEERKKEMVVVSFRVSTLAWWSTVDMPVVIKVFHGGRVRVVVDLVGLIVREEFMRNEMTPYCLKSPANQSKIE